MAEGIISDETLRAYYEKLLPYLSKLDKAHGAKADPFSMLDDEDKDMLRQCLQGALDLISDTVSKQSCVDPSLPPIGGDDRKEIFLTISVPKNWNDRLDMQRVIEREIRADRWNWRDK